MKPAYCQCVCAAAVTIRESALSAGPTLLYALHARGRLPALLIRHVHDINMNLLGCTLIHAECACWWWSGAQCCNTDVAMCMSRVACHTSVLCIIGSLLSQVVLQNGEYSITYNKWIDWWMTQASILSQLMRHEAMQEVHFWFLHHAMYLIVTDVP